MTAYVVDTNVLVVANGDNTDVSDDCQLACTELLSFVDSEGSLVVDDQFAVFGEYLRNVSTKNGGYGSRFLTHALQRCTEAAGRCIQVRLTQVSDDEGDFAEFPADVDLASFPRSDRKWVALAHACDRKPPIAVALDRAWPQYQEALRAVGVQIQLLCPQDIGRRGSPA